MSLLTFLISLFIDLIDEYTDNVLVFFHLLSELLSFL